MLKKNQIICHRGMWEENKEIQNAEKAVLDAKENGFSVELDLRVKDGVLGTGHDEWQEFNFAILKDLSFVAFHIKEEGILEAVSEMLKKYALSRFLIFGVSETEMPLYGQKFGYWNMAYEYFPSEDMDAFKKAITTPCSYIWMAELLPDNLTFIKNGVFEEFSKANKTTILVTPECLDRNHLEWSFRILTLMTEVHVDMVCTDVPHFFSEYAHKFE